MENKKCLKPPTRITLMWLETCVALPGSPFLGNSNAPSSEPLTFTTDEPLLDFPLIDKDP